MILSNLFSTDVHVNSCGTALRIPNICFQLSAGTSQKKEIILHFKFFFPVLYKFQKKSIFFYSTLVIFAHGGFGTAAMETEAVWLIRGQILCRQLQSKLLHPALPLTRALTCGTTPSIPQQLSPHFHWVNTDSSLKCQNIYVWKYIHALPGLCDFFYWIITKTTKCIWQSGTYWWIKSLSTCTLSLWTSYILNWKVTKWEKEKKNNTHTELPPPCDLMHLQQGSRVRLWICDNCKNNEHSKFTSTVFIANCWVLGTWEVKLLIHRPEYGFKTWIS